MSSLPAILLATTLTSLFGLVGGLLVLWKAEASRRVVPFLLSFAAGTILGATFFDLLPESIEQGGDVEHTLLVALCGVVTFFVVERLLVWHHHAHTHDIDSPPSEGHAHLPNPTAVRPLIIIGDALHNFLDGGVIAAAFLVDTRIGIIAALAVLAHELPQELGDFSILVQSGMKRARIILWNILGALVSPLGALLAFLAAEKFEALEPVLLAFGAGNFIYLALADLVPALHHQNKLRASVIQILILIAGILLMRQIGIWLPHEV